MKSDKDFFSEKMPSHLKSRILSQAETELAFNRSLRRRTILGWLLGAGLAAVAGSFSFIYVRQNELDQNLNVDLAQSGLFLEEIESEEDFDLVADYDLIENLDLIELIEQES